MWNQELRSGRPYRPPNEDGGSGDGSGSWRDRIKVRHSSPGYNERTKWLSFAGIERKGKDGRTPPVGAGRQTKQKAQASLLFLAVGCECEE